MSAPAYRLDFLRLLQDWRSVEDVSAALSVPAGTAYRWLSALVDAGEAVTLEPPRAVTGRRQRYYRLRFSLEPEDIGLDGADLALALIDHATDEAALRVAFRWARSVERYDGDAFAVLFGRAEDSDDPLQAAAARLHAEEVAALEQTRAEG